MNPRRYGNYVVLERLGVGGMSEVVLARKAVEEASFVRFVVIKRIKANRLEDPAFVRMFMDEARITAELHHANIAQVYDFGREGDEYYLTLEYVPGLDVRHIVNTLRERRERMPVPVALRIIHDVLEGLEYAHGKVDTFGEPMRIVHRDVNPRNVMVSIRGEVKLIDFGVAKATGRLERTRTDHVKGKFAYMSPEQVSGGEIDHRADLFAVGITLHELCTGYGPFYGLNQVQIMHRIMSGRVPELGPLPELRDASLLRSVHNRALQFEAADRYQTARSMRLDIVKVAARLGGLIERGAMARFLAYVEPDLESTVRDKLASYSGPIDVETADLEEPLPLDPVDTEPSSMSLVTRVAPGGLVAGSLLLGGGAVGAAVLVLAAVVAVVTLGSGLWRGSADPLDQPVQVAAPAPTVVEPEPAPSPPGGVDGVQEDEVVVEDATPTAPSRPAAVDPSPTPRSSLEVRPAIRAAPVPTPTPAGAAEPEESEPVGELDPPTQPEPVATGFLSITSADKGRAITINGRETPFTTPATRVEWPAGTVVVEVEGYPPRTVELPKSQVKMLSFR